MHPIATKALSEQLVRALLTCTSLPCADPRPTLIKSILGLYGKQLTLTRLASGERPQLRTAGTDATGALQMR